MALRDTTPRSSESAPSFGTPLCPILRLVDFFLKTITLGNIFFWKGLCWARMEIKSVWSWILFWWIWATYLNAIMILTKMIQSMQLNKYVSTIHKILAQLHSYEITEDILKISFIYTWCGSMQRVCLYSWKGTNRFYIHNLPR